MISKTITTKVAFLFLGIILASLIAPVLGNTWNRANAQETQGRNEGVQLNEDLRPDYAVDIIPSSNTNSQSDRTDSVNLILQLIAGSLIYIAGPIAVIIVAIGGMRYVLSHGDPTQMEEAKKTIIYALVGLIVIILSWSIMVNVIQILSQ